MKKRFGSLPKRLAAAILTAGLIVSSSNLEYVRFILPGVQMISHVEAEELTITTITDPNLLKAMEVVVNYKAELPETDMSKFKGDFTSDTYAKYQKPITVEQAQKYNDVVDLSECTGIKTLTGINVFKRIKSINISNYSGETISNKAFENCSELTKVIIPSTVTGIGDYAFNGCSSLSTIEVKDDATHNSEDILNLFYITKIGDSSFAASKDFKGVVFDSEKTGLAIGSSAFNSCEELVTIDIPTLNYTDLGQGVFQNCTNLKQATLNPELKAIPNNFFSHTDMSKMTSFPKALERIGKDAFANTKLLTPDLSGCNKLVLIDQGAFQGVKYTDNPETDTFILPDSLAGSGDLNVEDENVGNGIRRIAFFNSSLKKIKIPDGITEIQDSVFEGCTYLTDVKFGKDSKLVKINDWAFRRCQYLTSTEFIKDLPSLKEIGAYAFSECYYLSWSDKYDDEGNWIAYTPDQDDFGVYIVGGGLKTVILPESLEKIDAYAFANDYGLETISMGNKVNTISEYAFANQADTAHKNIGIARLVEILNSKTPFDDQQLLAYAARLSKVTLSNSLVEIGEAAFKTNAKLKTVTYNGVEETKDGFLVLPTSVKKIGDKAFADCSRFSKKDIDNDGKDDYEIYGLTSVDLRYLDLESLGESVFENNIMLDTVNLPINLKVIPKKLFYIDQSDGKRVIDIVEVSEDETKKVIKKLPGVNSIVFPIDLEEISESAFEGCENLKKKFTYIVDEDDGDIEKNGVKYVVDEVKYEENINKQKVSFDQLPSTLKTIANRAFYGCCSLGYIATDESLRSIGEEAFMSCSIPDLNVEISPNTFFEKGFGLTKITFVPSKNLETIGAKAFKYTVIDRADLSNNKMLENIPDEVFANCYYLKETLLPENVSQIGSKAYSSDYSLKNVQFPAIANIKSDIFDGDIFFSISDTIFTLSARTSDRLVKVPLGQSVKLNFVKVVSNSNAVEYNDYKIVQKLKSGSTSEKFIQENVDDKEDVYLTGIKDTTDNAILEISNMVEFDFTLDGEAVQQQATLFKDYDLTVSNQYAEKLSITGPKEKIQVAEDGSKTLSLSVNDTTPVDVTASVEPSPLSKAPIWTVDSTDVISVDPINPDDKDTLTAVNESNISIGRIQVKGGGVAKLTVSNGLLGDKEVKDEITVKVIYPVDVSNTKINIGSVDADTDSYKLEEGKTDVITVKPAYPEEASEADADSKAKVYFTSENEEIATVDRTTGQVTAIKSGDTTINVYDETGTLIKNIRLNVVKDKELTPNNIKISKNRIDVYKGENSDLITAKVYPYEDYLQGVTWSVENTDIAGVSNNEDGSATVIGKDLGETNLVATSKVDGNVVGRAVINVSVPVTAIKFLKDSATVAVDGTLEIGMTNEVTDDLRLFYEPSDSSNNSVTWKLDDESIATFDDTTNKNTLYDGIPSIKGVKQGTTKLTVTTANGLSATIDINVYQPLTDFSVEESKTLHNGDTFKLNVVKTPTDSSEGLTYSSSNEEVATVDAEGNVKAIAEGQASIYVTRLSNSEYKACDVTVIEKVNAISILDAPIEISVEGTYTIGKAADGDDVKVGYRLNPNSSDLPTWSSSNPEIASVQSESGNVTIKGVAPGTATITATMSSGATTTITVNVVSLSTELKFTEERKTVAVGTQTSVSLIKTPENTTEGIEFTSSDETIAKVDQNGVVTGIAKGEVTITAKGKISGVSAGITITVTVPSTGVKIVTEYASEKKIYLVKGSSYQLQYKLLPEETTDKVSFTTNKKKIANVSEDGTISAKKKGNATITVKTESGKKATIKVYVVSKEKNAKKIKIKTSSIKVGKTVKLKYSITPTATTNTLSYSVNKPNIAEIDEYGYITGLKKGKVKVTVTASNGKKKTKTIKVK